MQRRDWSMQDGLTALHCAARNGHVATTAQLLKLNASLTSRTRRGLTALHLAVQGDHTQCVQLLTQASNVNDVTNVRADAHQTTSFMKLWSDEVTTKAERFDFDSTPFVSHSTRFDVKRRSNRSRTVVESRWMGIEQASNRIEVEW